MGKYSGLDKINTKGLRRIEKHCKAVIYECTNDENEIVSKGYLVVRNGYVIDSQISSIDNAKFVASHFDDL